MFGSDPELDPELFAGQVRSGSKTQRKMGSGSGSKKIVSDPQHCISILLSVWSEVGSGVKSE
jgi:hypothetical protein